MIMRMGLPIEETVGFKITVCDMKGVLVEGHGGLLSYSSEEIVLRIKRSKKLALSGEDLTLNEVSCEEAYIRGKLKSIEVIDG